jgi:hypothetical protein
MIHPHGILEIQNTASPGHYGSDVGDDIPCGISIVGNIRFEQINADG